MTRRRVVALVSGDVQGEVLQGRVEVVLEGPEDDVRAVLEALTGPEAAGAPRDVAVTDEDTTGTTGFTTA